MLAYVVGLMSLPVVAWLTYLELAVIGAVCAWCVAYAVLVIVTWVLALAALRGHPRSPRDPGSRATARGRPRGAAAGDARGGMRRQPGPPPVTYQRDWPDGFHEELTVLEDGKVTMRHGEDLERLTLTADQCGSWKDSLASGLPAGDQGDSVVRTVILGNGTVHAPVRVEPGFAGRDAGGPDDHPLPGWHPGRGGLATTATLDDALTNGRGSPWRPWGGDHRPARGSRRGL